jgi:hypothetical protein
MDELIKHTFLEISNLMTKKNKTIQPADIKVFTSIISYNPV